jgi:hypothetical protein
MATGEITIGIPGAGASNFATTPIPSLVLYRASAEAPLASRSELGFSTLEGRSNWGTSQVSGPNYSARYSWAIAAMLTEDQARQLGALAKWQDGQYKGQSDGKLRLIDELEPLDPEPTPHSRTLLSALNPSWNAAYSYGYGVFDVLLQLPEDWRQQVGRWATGEGARLVTFVAVEL